MALRGIITNQTFEYVPWCQRHIRDPKDRTSILVRRPGLELMKKIQNDAIKQEQKGFKSTTIFEQGTAQLMVLRECVVGYRNLLGPDGIPMKFNGADTASRDVSLEAIPPEIREEVVNFLTGQIAANRRVMEMAAERGVDVDAELNFETVVKPAAAKPAASVQEAAVA